MKILAPISFFAFLLLAASVSAGSASGAEPSFTFSADPTKKLLWVELGGNEEVTTATVFGDGQIEYSRESRDRSRLIAKASSKFTFEEVRDLLATALRSGLADYDEVRLRKQVDSITTAQPPLSLYTGTTTIGFTLESLDQREDVEIEIRCKNVAGLATTYPTIREYQGIEELTQRLFAHWHAAFRRSNK